MVGMASGSMLLGRKKAVIFQEIALFSEEEYLRLRRFETL